MKEALQGEFSNQLILPIILLLLASLGHFGGLMDATLLPRFLCISLLFTWLLFQSDFEWRFSLWSPSGLLFLYFSYLILHYFLLGNSSEGLLEVLRIFSAFGVFLVVEYLLKKQTAFDRFLFPLLLLIITTHLMVLVWEGISLENDQEGLPNGLAGHVNLLGAQFFLFFGLLAVQLLYRPYRRVLNFFGFLMLALLLLLPIILEVRSATLAFFALGIFMMLSFWLGKKASVLIGGIGMLGILLVSFLVAATNIDERWIASFQLYEIDYLQTWIERARVWSKSWQLWQENPLLGIGLGNWQIAFPAQGLENIYSATLDRTTFQRPHNDFIWTLCEAGPMGLLFQLSIFVYPFIRIFRSPNFKVSGKMKLLLGTWLGFMVISAVSFPKERPALIIWSMFLLAYIHHFLPPQKASQPWPKMILLLPIFLSLIIIGGRAKGEFYTKKLLTSYQQNQFEAVTTFAEKAENIFYRIDPTSMPLTWYAATLQFKHNEIEMACENFEKALKLAPHNFHLLNDWGTCLELAGKRSAAIEHYEEALRINPIFEDAKRNLTIVLIKGKNWEKAAHWANQIKNKEWREEYLQLIQEK